MAKTQVAYTPTYGRTGYRLRRQVGRLIRLLLAYPLVTVLSFLFAFPFFWMVSLSLKDMQQIATVPIQWLPNPVRWENYRESWNYAPFAIFYKNTIIFTLLGMTFQCVSSIAVAFGFSRLRFRGRDTLFILLLSTMMLPPQVLLMPRYLMFNALNWIDSIKPLVVPELFGTPFYIFLIRQFFLTMPLEMDEAALIDGAGYPTILIKILLPVCKPILVTIIAFSFIAHWNEFFGPLIYLNSQEKMVVAVALSQFRAEMFVYMHLMMAAAVINLVPMALVFLLCQRYFVTGITMTGLKEG